MIAVMAAFAVCANAQVWVGGELGFNFKSWNKDAQNIVNYDGEHLYGDKTQSIVYLAPEVGYQINDNLDVAMAIELGTTNNVNGWKDAGNAFRWGICPYVRYTFAKTGQVGFFVDGGVDVEVTNPKGDKATRDLWVGIRPGVKFAASDRVTLVAHLGSLGYLNSKYDKCQSNEFGLNANTRNLGIGLYYSF